jgi:peptidoglycan/LPS O-acetylase OafA/YrhL
VNASPHRSNNFDLIRLVAALQVVLSHAVGHTGLIDRLPAWERNVFEYLAWLPGVPVFFVISGFLIARSYENSRGDSVAYAWRRFLRIYPALWVCLGVTILTIGAFGFLTREFLGSPTFPAWLAGQATFVQFFNPAQFRDFGIGVANGALWSITVELQFYVFVPLLYGTLFRKRKRLGKVGGLVLCGLIAGSFFLWCLMDHALTGPGGYTGAPMGWKLMFVTLAPHFWMFSFGILAHRYWRYLAHWIEGTFIHWLSAYLVLMWVREVAFEPRSVWFYAGYFPSRVLLALVTISAAYSAKTLSGRLLRGQDISYGVYIYHSIVINVFVELGLLDSLVSVLWIVLASLALAWLSWVTVEKPAMGYKSTSPVLWWRRFRNRSEASS